MPGETGGTMRCPRCRSMLDRSGREPHRYECPNCKQDYFLVMQLVPVPSAHATLCQSEGKEDAERRSGTG